MWDPTDSYLLCQGMSSDSPLFSGCVDANGYDSKRDEVSDVGPPKCEAPSCFDIKGRQIEGYPNCGAPLCFMPRDSNPDETSIEKRKKHKHKHEKVTSYPDCGAPICME